MHRQADAGITVWEGFDEGMNCLFLRMHWTIFMYKI